MPEALSRRRDSAPQLPLKGAAIAGVLPERPMQRQEPALMPIKALGRQLTVGRRSAIRCEPGLGEQVGSNRVP